MQERALINDKGCISVAGPGEGNTFALCIAQAPLIPGTTTAMLVVSRVELKRWIEDIAMLLDGSVR